MECLTLTVEEVMHIRQVLVKAELEKFQQYKDVYNALKKGKVALPLWSLTFGWLALMHSHKYFWGFLFLFLALLLVSREEVLLLHLGVHVPVLQEVRAHFLGKMIQLPERMKSKDLILPFFPGQCARSAPRR